MSRALPVATILLLILPGGLLLSQTSIVDSRSMHLRIFGADAEPIGYKSGAIRFLDRKKGRTNPEGRIETLVNPIFDRSLIFPDLRFTFSDGSDHARIYDPRENTYRSDSTGEFDGFPVDLEVTEGNHRMVLRLDADVDSIRFREGTYHIPWRFEPLFFVYGFNGRVIHGKDIADFEVDDRTESPHLPSIPTDSFLTDSMERRFLHDAPPFRSLSASWTWDWHKERIMVLSNTYTTPPGDVEHIYHLSSLGHAEEWRVRTGGLGVRGKIMATSFPDRDHGWITIDTGWYHYVDPYLVLRTTNGGESWETDSLLTEKNILQEFPRGRESAWFVGLEPEGNYRGRLAIYSGPVDGSRLVPMNLGSSLELHYQANDFDGGHPIVYAGGENYLIVRDPFGDSTGFRYVAIDADGVRITHFSGWLEDHVTLPDSTSLMIVRDRPVAGSRRDPEGLPSDRYGPYHFPSYLLHISSDGREVDTVLVSGYPLHQISFADVSTGAVAGGTFVLLTVDGGASWRFLPFDRVENDGAGGAGSPIGVGIGIGPFWPSPDTLRLACPDGYMDIPIDRLSFPEEWDDPVNYIFRKENRR